MKITALAPWFGGKRNLASRIVEELGPHRVYWEPFCGSMAVLLAKPQCAMENVNDLHGDLVNLARVIQDEQLGPRLYRKLRRTLMCHTLHQEAAARHRGRGYLGDVPADLEAAYDYFLFAWMGRNGVAGTSSYSQGFSVRYTGNGGHGARRFTSAVDSIPKWRRRLRNVTILCHDAFGLLERIDDAPGTAVYCDPPYLVKGAKYVHDFSGEDHQRLAELLGRFRRARVVVSYYDHPLLDELYPDWRRRTIDVSKSLVHAGQRGSSDVRATEVLLVNDSNARRLF